MLETADILRAGTDAATIMQWLRERTEDRLMIVGHNPALSDLITLLVLGSCAFGTAGPRPEERRDRRAQALHRDERSLRTGVGGDAGPYPKSVRQLKLLQWNRN